MSELNNPALSSFDDLLDAGMDDLADLPPVGVPPTGQYVLEVTCTRETSDKEGGNDYIKMQYEVIEISELKNPEEAGEAAVGMKFSAMFSPFKKTGEVNDMGLGFLKEAIAPYAAHFGTQKVGDTIAAINKVRISASLTKVKDRRDEDRYNARIKDVIIL